MPARQGSVASPAFMNGAQQECEHVASLEAGWFHIGWKKYKGYRSQGKGQHAGCEEGTELPVIHSKNDPGDGGEPKEIAKHIWQYPYRPNGKDIHRQLGFDASCNLVAGWNIDHLYTAG